MHELIGSDGSKGDRLVDGVDRGVRELRDVYRGGGYVLGKS